MRMSFVWVLVCMMAATGLIACGDGGGGSSSSGGNTGTAPRAFNLIPGTNGTGNGSTNVSLTPKLEWVNSKQVGDEVC